MATHLRITGLVQGVGYRYAFEMQARALRLAGWIRNRADGSVEAVVRGEPETVEKIITWSRRGPSTARVTDVAISEVDDTSVTSDRFEIKPTA